MLCKKINVLAILILFIANGCIKQVKVDTRYEGRKLVVEGSITTDTIPYTVRLTYTRPVTAGNKIPDEFFEKDAQVYITDDLGKSTSLSYVDNGFYTTHDSSYIGKVGRTYSVNVVLSDGKKYVSAPEKILPPVAIDKVTVLYDAKFDIFLPPKMVVYIDLTDPANQENFYNWVFSSWVPRKTQGISCGIGCIMFEYCYQLTTNSSLQVYSDAAINGNKITNRLMGISPIYWYGNHFMDIAQQTISREAYQFSVRFNEQQTRTGSILDPLPASIKGNVYNAADSNDFALGYFSAASVTHKKAILSPYSITQYQLDISAVEFIPPGPQICFEAFENAMPYPPPPARQNPPPPGWEHAEVIEVRW